MRVMGSMRVMGLAGWSGAGKTTLLDRLIPALIARGLVVSTLKHAHHNFDIDSPGTDTWMLRQAGANEVIAASPGRWALIHELRDAEEPPLPKLLARMSRVDLVLIEGFKREAHPKIEIYRQANAKPPLHTDDPSIIAVASDIALPGLAIPVYHLDDIEGIADVVQACAVPIESLDWS
jgi:molybdopterin-guanine dinucleotide biosynthesis adapter protein